jgi:hypothetical protein
MEQTYGYLGNTATVRCHTSYVVWQGSCGCGFKMLRGRTSWFNRKKLSGSYFAFSFASFLYFSSP